MRILLLTTHLNIGGIGTYIVTLAKALKVRRHEVFVASGGGLLLPELTSGGVSHIKIDIQTKSELSPKVFKAVFEIRKLVRKLDIDIIHAHTRVTQVAGFLASRLCKIGFVTTCHGFFRRKIGRILFPAWGDRVIAISEAVQEHLIRDFSVNKKKISLIYNGIDAKRFLREISEEKRLEVKDRFGLRRNHLIIGTIARFTPDKGHDVLLYALYRILKEKPNVQLLFIGDGKERLNIIDLTQRLNISENVIFVRPQINTVDALSIIDVFMFTPRRKEGLGMAVLEALASGKPVVATNVGGIASIVENGVNGFLVQPSRPELLVEPALRLLKDKGLYKKMAQAGREIVIRKFSIDGMVERMETVYNQICGMMRDEQI